MRLLIERIQGLKHQPSDCQAAELMDASKSFLHTAAPIRAALEAVGGIVVAVVVRGTDQEVVLLALLAILADDIATLPDSRLRAKSMALHRDVIQQVGMAQNDAEFFRQNIRLFEHVLAG